MPLNMIVPVKQVPDTKNVTGDAMNADGTVNRGALPAIFNPDDLCALELALTLKDRYGGTVTVITMGPPRAIEVLKETLYRNSDRVVLLSDRRFAAADTLATSYALAQAITTQMSPYDLVICGRQAIDGDTAQVGPQIAEKLSIPQVTYAEEVISMNEGKLRIRRNLGRSQEIVEANLPLLLTVIEGAQRPRWPDARKMLKFRRSCSTFDLAAKAEKTGQPIEALTQEAMERNLFVETLDADAIQAEPGRIGLKGSPTKVKKINSLVLKGEDLQLYDNTDSAVKSLVEHLLDEKTCN